MILSRSRAPLGDTSCELLRLQDTLCILAGLGCWCHTLVMPDGRSCSLRDKGCSQTVLSADHASSAVMCTRMRWFATFMSACSEMPVDAASLITATSFSPFWKASFSAMFTCRKR